MKLLRITPVVMFAVGLASTPALADQRQGERGRNEGQAVQRSRGGENRPAEGPRVSVLQREAAAQRAVPPSVENGRRFEDSRNVGAPRYDAGRAAPNRDYVAPRAVPRSEFGPRREWNERREHDVIVEPRVYAPRYYGSYGGFYGYRPYVFRPRTRLSFGIFLGFGVPYTYAYPYPVTVYGYGAPSAPVYIGPSSTIYGGISLEISPSDAEVFVDGRYIGLVRDFDGTTAPLNLVAGRHRVELSAAGYAPLAMDVDVIPGQLVPYRGEMQPAGW